MNVVNMHVRGPCTLTTMYREVTLYLPSMCLHSWCYALVRIYVPWSILWCHQNQLETAKFDSISHASIPSVKCPCWLHLWKFPQIEFIISPSSWRWYFWFNYYYHCGGGGGGGGWRRWRWRWCYWWWCLL